MNKRSEESIFNLGLGLSSIDEDFEISNRNLTRLMWQKYGLGLFLLIGLTLLLTGYMIAIQRGYIQFRAEGRKILHLLISVIGVAAAMRGVLFVVWQWIKLFRNRRILFHAYPELDNELANLRAADYIDEYLQVYIYGNHLVSISFDSWFSIIDLTQFQLMEIKTKKVSEDVNVHRVNVTLDSGKVIKLVMPNFWATDTIQRLEELQEYIDTYY